MTRALGRLLRLSLAPSAAADVVAGLVFASGGAWPSSARAFWLVPASLGVYHGALALNDWNDREHDGRTRPARPIPSGSVSATNALALGLALVALGIACAFLAAPASALWMAGVAALALAYDWCGRGALVGPVLLALCRAGNLGSGVFFVLHVTHEPLALAWFTPCIAYGFYVFLVSRLGRMEDAEDSAPLGVRPSLLLACIALALFVPLALPPLFAVERVPAFVLAGAAAYGLVRTALTTRAWTRALVERAMGSCLRRLLVFTAIVTLVSARRDVHDAWIAAACILAGYPIAHALRRVFPPS